MSKSSSARAARKKSSSVLQYPPVEPSKDNDANVAALRNLINPDASPETNKGERFTDQSDSGESVDAYENQVLSLAFSAIDRHQKNVRRSMDPGDLTALEASLKQHGLMHPVIVEPIPDKHRGYRYRLVAGFRRVAAARNLGWTHIPARVLRNPLEDVERVTFQMAENMQRESMRLRDIVESVQNLRSVGLTQSDIAERLGLAESTVRLYRQLGDILEKYPKLWTHFDKGLISIDHFRAAHRLLARVRQRAGEVTTDPVTQAKITDQAEQLFVDMLERLANVQPLTTKRVAKEVALLLEQAGIEKPPTSPSPSSNTGIRLVLAGYEKLQVSDLSSEELQKFITVSERKLAEARRRINAK